MFEGIVLFLLLVFVCSCLFIKCQVFNCLPVKVFVVFKTVSCWFYSFVFFLNRFVFVC